ncbi:isochorismatase [Nemania sp. NC0429]|nr:isochorismatase [Nemania sp. NC0429]
MAPASSPVTALLLIDVQEGFREPPFTGWSTPDFEANVTRLLAAFRAAGENAHVIHVHHHSRTEASTLHPSRPGVRVSAYAAPRPGEVVRTKDVNSALVGTGVEQLIRDLGVERLVIAGLTTGHCVSTTARMASNLRVVDHPHGGVAAGHDARGEIVVVSDATAMYDHEYEGEHIRGDTLHRLHLATLHGEFCVVRNTEEVVGLLSKGAP